MCSVPHLILKHLISPAVSLAQLLSLSVALPAQLVSVLIEVENRKYVIRTNVAMADVPLIFIYWYR